MKAIQTYIISLSYRKDRRLHIQNQFLGKKEFQVVVVDAIENNNGAIGLWITIRQIIEMAKEHDYILICEDDHQFTEMYSYRILKACIDNAILLKADVLCGGPSWVNTALPVAENIYWTEKFSGLQFTIIFSKFYDTILKASFSDLDAADYKISELSENKLMIHPFISVQKEFGYSDVTINNNTEGHVEHLFQMNDKVIPVFANIYSSAKRYRQKNKASIKSDINSIVIPVYIIAATTETQILDLTYEQFDERKEFFPTIIRLNEDVNLSESIWNGIRRAVNEAIRDEEDVIIISSEKSSFSREYNTYFLIKNIIEAYEIGADFISCASEPFQKIVPLSENLFWIDNTSSLDFIVLFKKSFGKILDEPFNENMNPGFLLSEIASSKMMMYPSISEGGQQLKAEQIRTIQRIATFWLNDKAVL